MADLSEFEDATKKGGTALLIDRLHHDGLLSDEQIEKARAAIGLYSIGTISRVVSKWSGVHVSEGAARNWVRNQT